MGSQGFRNIAGNPFVYQEDTRSAAFGLDLAAQTWKVSVKATAGALPTDTAQLTIDPATNGNVTIDPNGSGNLVVSSGDVSLTAGNLALPATTSTLGQIKFGGDTFFHALGGDSVWIGKSAGNLANTYAASSSSVALGSYSLSSLTTNVGGTLGIYNLGIGRFALNQATTAVGCVAIGGSNSYGNIDGNYNTNIGGLVGYFLTHGSYNVLIGSNSYNVSPYGAGGNYTNAESSNICIMNYGVTGESNVIRIGTSGSGAGQQNKAYIAGTYGVTPGGTINIALVDSNGQLGSTATLSPSLGGKMTWTTATADATAAVNTGYLIKHATPATKLVITLPATAALYSEIEIDGYTAGLWRLAQASGQTIHFGSIDTTTGTGGYLEATNKYDSVLIRCVVADTEFLVVRVQGTISVV